MPSVGAGSKQNFQGVWSSAATYAFNDVVYFNGSSYLALLASTNVSPSAQASNATWALLALQGLNGTALNLTTKTAAYTAVINDLVLANATTAGFTVTLPNAPVVNATIAVKKTDSSSNIVTVVPSGATATIEGDVNLTLIAQGATATMQYDGANWYVQSTSVLGASSSASDTLVASSVPTYLSQSWYGRRALSSTLNLGSVNITNGSTVVAASTIVYIPVFSHKTISIDTVGFCSGATAVSGSVIRLGLYSATAAGLPNALLYDWGQMTASSTTSTFAAYGVSTSVFPRGWSFYAISCTSTVPGSFFGVNGVQPTVGIPNASMNASVALYTTGPTHYTATGNAAASAFAATASGLTAVYPTTSATSFPPEVFVKVV